ncbi:hypothetical protein Dimus_001131 [Dionaea muscipula]
MDAELLPSELEGLGGDGLGSGVASGVVGGALPTLFPPAMNNLHMAKGGGAWDGGRPATAARIAVGLPPTDGRQQRSWSFTVGKPPVLGGGVWGQPVGVVLSQEGVADSRSFASIIGGDRRADVPL